MRTRYILLALVVTAGCTGGSDHSIEPIDKGAIQATSSPPVQTPNVGGPASVAPNNSNPNSPPAINTGSYTNPILWSDFPDPDIIAVDGTFYLISTTMYFMPGATILKSTDLIHWQYAANPITDLQTHDPCYNLQGCSAYARGQWATSIRYNNKNWYVLFSVLNAGMFAGKAPQVDGPWTINQVSGYFHDPGLLFDDDGKIYVASGYGNIGVDQLDENLTPIAGTHVGNLFVLSGIEGNHFYKINNTYYILCSMANQEYALRSSSPTGPYESQLIFQNQDQGWNIHQAGLVQTSSGQWWAVMIMENGSAVGRSTALFPVTFNNGWPSIGQSKPNAPVPPGLNQSIDGMHASDDFSSATLGLMWEWNHNPDNTRWSLKENPGFLRLHTNPGGNDLTMVRNVLTQRAWAPTSTATAEIDATGLQDGDHAGLAILGPQWISLAVVRQNNNLMLVVENNGQQAGTAAISTPHIYLRAILDAVGNTGQLFYSSDGKTFSSVGPKASLVWNLSTFTGNRFGLFSYSTGSNALGYADFNGFTLQ